MISAASPLNKIFCLIGPSGTGKDAIAKRIPLPQIVSMRTRQPRTGEVDGVHGHFVSKEEFLELKEQDLLLAETVYDGHYYGITQGELLELEQSPMLYVVDWNGVISLRENISKIQGYTAQQIVTIFIHTPREDLESRMKRRGSMTAAEIKARLDHSDRDYASSSLCDYVVINRNGEIETTTYEIMRIIFAEQYHTQDKYHAPLS